MVVGSRGCGNTAGVPAAQSAQHGSQGQTDLHGQSNQQLTSSTSRSSLTGMPSLFTMPTLRHAGQPQQEPQHQQHHYHHHSDLQSDPGSAEFCANFRTDTEALSATGPAAKYVLPPPPPLTLHTPPAQNAVSAHSPAVDQAALATSGGDQGRNGAASHMEALSIDPLVRFLQQAAPYLSHSLASTLASALAQPQAQQNTSEETAALSPAQAPATNKHLHLPAQTAETNSRHTNVFPSPSVSIDALNLGRSVHCGFGLSLAPPNSNGPASTPGGSVDADLRSSSNWASPPLTALQRPALSSGIVTRRDQLPRQGFAADDVKAAGQTLSLMSGCVPQHHDAAVNGSFAKPLPPSWQSTDVRSTVKQPAALLDRSGASSESQKPRRSSAVFARRPTLSESFKERRTSSAPRIFPDSCLKQADMEVHDKPVMETPVMPKPVVLSKQDIAHQRRMLRKAVRQKQRTAQGLPSTGGLGVQLLPHAVAPQHAGEQRKGYMPGLPSKAGVKVFDPAVALPVEERTLNINGKALVIPPFWDALAGSGSMIPGPAEVFEMEGVLKVRSTLR